MRDRETKRERERKPGGSVSSSMDNKLQILKKKGNILKFQWFSTAWSFMSVYKSVPSWSIHFKL